VERGEEGIKLNKKHEILNTKALKEEEGEVIGGQI
jgi:hypothetical protein